MASAQFWDITATVFLAAGLVMLLSLHDLGLLVGSRPWIAAVWSLAECMTAALAGGGRIYLEAA